ncbi:MAG: hypothetical protein H7199_13360 [Burkholderiales bacterium]|nr:hypothetical protein [Flavobacterium sp.]
MELENGGVILEATVKIDFVQRIITNGSNFVYLVSTIDSTNDIYMPNAIQSNLSIGLSTFGNDTNMFLAKFERPWATTNFTKAFGSWRPTQTTAILFY